MSKKIAYKCLVCGEKFSTPEDLYTHYETEHEESILPGYSARRYHYYLKTGKTEGKCVVGGEPTPWNENTGKYCRMCGSKQCHDKYVNVAKRNMIKKYGKVHLLNDPEKQREMLANRSISGVYEWSDKKHSFPYTGSYELSFLQFLDLVMDWDPTDIMCPSPHNYVYELDGVERFYFPDVFIISIESEIECKDGGLNPNTNPGIIAETKRKEKIKDALMKSQKNVNFAKITDKNNAIFIRLLQELKIQFELSKGDKDQLQRVFVLGDQGVFYSSNIK